MSSSSNPPSVASPPRRQLSINHDLQRERSPGSAPSSSPRLGNASGNASASAIGRSGSKIGRPSPDQRRPSVSSTTSTSTTGTSSSVRPTPRLPRLATTAAANSAARRTSVASSNASPTAPKSRRDSMASVSSASPPSSPSQISPPTRSSSIPPPPGSPTMRTAPRSPLASPHRTPAMTSTSSLSNASTSSVRLPPAASTSKLGLKPQFQASSSSSLIASGAEGGLNSSSPNSRKLSEPRNIVRSHQPSPSVPVVSSTLLQRGRSPKTSTTAGSAPTSPSSSGSRLQTFSDVGQKHGNVSPMAGTGTTTTMGRSDGIGVRRAGTITGGGTVRGRSGVSPADRARLDSGSLPKPIRGGGHGVSTGELETSIKASTEMMKGARTVEIPRRVDLKNVIGENRPNGLGMTDRNASTGTFGTFGQASGSAKLAHVSKQEQMGGSTVRERPRSFGKGKGKQVESTLNGTSSLPPVSSVSRSQPQPARVAVTSTPTPKRPLSPKRPNVPAINATNSMPGMRTTGPSSLSHADGGDSSASPISPLVSAPTSSDSSPVFRTGDHFPSRLISEKSALRPPSGENLIASRPSSARDTLPEDYQRGRGKVSNFTSRLANHGKKLSRHVHVHLPKAHGSGGSASESGKVRRWRHKDEAESQQHSLPESEKSSKEMERSENSSTISGKRQKTSFSIPHVPLPLSSSPLGASSPSTPAGKNENPSPSKDPPANSRPNSGNREKPRLSLSDRFFGESPAAAALQIFESARAQSVTSSSLPTAVVTSPAILTPSPGLSSFGTNSLDGISARSSMDSRSHEGSSSLFSDSKAFAHTRRQSADRPVFLHPPISAPELDSNTPVSRASPSMSNTPPTSRATRKVSDRVSGMTRSTSLASKRLSDSTLTPTGNSASLGGGGVKRLSVLSAKSNTSSGKDSLATDPPELAEIGVAEKARRSMNTKAKASKVLGMNDSGERCGPSGGMVGLGISGVTEDVEGEMETNHGVASSSTNGHVDLLAVEDLDQDARDPMAFSADQEGDESQDKTPSATTKFWKRGNRRTKSDAQIGIARSVDDLRPTARRVHPQIPPSTAPSSSDKETHASPRFFSKTSDPSSIDSASSRTQNPKGGKRFLGTGARFFSSVGRSEHKKQDSAARVFATPASPADSKATKVGRIVKRPGLKSSSKSGSEFNRAMDQQDADLADRQKIYREGKIADIKEIERQIDEQKAKQALASPPRPKPEGISDGFSTGLAAPPPRTRRRETLGEMSRPGEKSSEKVPISDKALRSISITINQKEVAVKRSRRDRSRRREDDPTAKAPSRPPLPDELFKSANEEEVLTVSETGISSSMTPSDSGFGSDILGSSRSHSISSMVDRKSPWLEGNESLRPNVIDLTTSKANNAPSSTFSSTSTGGSNVTKSTNSTTSTKKAAGKHHSLSQIMDSWPSSFATRSSEDLAFASRESSPSFERESFDRTISTSFPRSSSPHNLHEADLSLTPTAPSPSSSYDQRRSDRALPYRQHTQNSSTSSLASSCSNTSMASSSVVSSAASMSMPHLPPTPAGGFHSSMKLDVYPRQFQQYQPQEDGLETLTHGE